jgi:myo-inositol-1(or 4)-monophosphatase
MQPLLNIAVRAARRAGDIIVRAIPRIEAVEVHSKGRNDYVTEVDRAAEADIIETIRRLHPDHAFLAEESGQNGSGDVLWIIDPLDGTTNFLHGFPQYAIAIAYRHRGVVTHGVVYDPTRNDLFTASRGRGAYLNDQRMRVSKRAHLASSLIGTGFPFRQIEHLDVYLSILRDVMKGSAGLRRAGSATLDLAYVAAGRLDGFWEFGLAPWDMAAGGLFITEAGGLVSDLAGEERFLETGNIVCGSPKVFVELLQAVQRHLTPALKKG